MLDTETITTPIGKLRICSKNGKIYSAYFVDKKNPEIIIYDEFVADIQEYFNGTNSDLSYDVFMDGTTFQKKVWKQIMKIPYGTTKTYSQIATKIGHPNACRAVANACGQNKIALFIPCHRVVGKKDIGGYKWGINEKKYLLELEKNNI